MKKYILSSLLIFSAFFTASATHLVSVDGNVTLIDTQTANGLWKYQVEITLVRDCNSSNVQFDPSIDLGIYGVNSKMLLKIFNITKAIEQDYIVESGFNICFREARYSGILEISKPTQDLILQYKRCCLPSLVNVIDDAGMNLNIHVFKDIPLNQATSVLNRKLVIISAKGINLELNKCFDFPYADSVVLKTDSFYIGGVDIDPIPAFSSTYQTPEAGSFRNNYEPGNPFGNLSPVNILSPDSINFTLNSAGRFLLPLTYSVYYNGKGVTFNKVLHVYSISIYPNNVSRLNLVKQTQNNLELSAFQLGHTQIDSFILQKSTGQNAFMFSNYKLNLTKTDIQAIYDSNVVYGEYYQYRTKIVSQGNTYYSDTVSVQYSLTSVQSINDNKILYYPNPAKSFVQLEIQNTTDFQIVDITGKVVLAGNISPENSKIELSSLAGGTYWIQVENSRYKLIHIE